MHSVPIETLLCGDPVLRAAEKTDLLFPLPAGSFDFKGPMDTAARFIQEKQLLDRELFAKFVNVYKERPRLDTQNEGWRGEYWGKMMRGGCITYAYTQDAALLEVLTQTAEDIIGSAEEDGRISSYDRDRQWRGWDVWCRKYVMLGLEYFLPICPDAALYARVLDAVRREADVMIAELGGGIGQTDIVRTARFWSGIASSSVLEPIMRLYFLTKEQKYLDFAAYIVGRGGSSAQDIFRTALEDTLPLHRYAVIKAYEMISCFEGLLEYYRATGIEKYKTAALNFARRIREEETSLIGTLGCWHELFDHTRTRQFSTEYADVMQETCVTVTYLKFCTQLLRLTGESIYGDEMERAMYNALLGAVNFEYGKNHALHFDSYSPLLMNIRGRYVGGKQILSDGSHYGCCACIGAAGTGIVMNTAAFLFDEGVAVNFYLPGTIATQTPTGAALELDVRTDYPGDGAIAITVAARRPEVFTVSLRIPAWSHRTTLAVNGIKYDAPAGGFLPITRRWQTGDRIELWLDMRTEILTPPAEALPDANAQYHVALRRGPLVLARDSRLPGDIRTPVAFRETERGYAEVTPAPQPSFGAFFAFNATLQDGSPLPLIDYASAGRSFDNSALVSAWMPTKDYYSVDTCRPFTLRAACRTRSNTPGVDQRSALQIKDGTLMTTNRKDKTLVVTPQAVADGGVLLAVAGGFLAVDENDVCVVAKKGTRFYLGFEGLCRYHLRTAEGKLLKVSPDQKERPVTAELSPVFPAHLFELVNV